MANIEKHLPYRFAKIEEFVELCKAENPEFENMEAIREKWLANKFPTEADLDGIKIWETILDITPGEHASIEDRRFNILTKLNARLPYTWAQLHRMMAAICGKEGYELELKDFVLMVYLSMDSSSKLYAVYDMLIEVLPMNILIDIEQHLEQIAHMKSRSYNLNNLYIQIVPYQIREKRLDVEPAYIASGIQSFIDIKIQPKKR